MSVPRLTERVFVWLGVALVAYAGGTVAYGEMTQRYQSWKFSQEAAAASAIEPVAVRKESIAELREGDRVGRLEIPRLGLSVIVFQGVEEGALVAGAGHVPGTPSPGGDGNVVIAGHRDTYFRKLEGLVPGDRVRVTTLRGIYEYLVDSTETVDPGDTQLMESRDRNELTLITCFPFNYVGSAPRRFIVHAYFQAVQ